MRIRPHVENLDAEPARNCGGRGRENFAQFPECDCCGALKISAVSDEPIRLRRISNGAIIELPRGQKSQLVRFVAQHRPRQVLSRHLYRALGDSDQYSRTIVRLRDEHGVDIHHDYIKKVGSPGQFAAYCLDGDLEVVAELGDDK